jgi:hypothetical protein
MCHHISSAMAGVVACYAVAGPSQAAPISDNKRSQVPPPEQSQCYQILGFSVFLPRFQRAHSFRSPYAIVS